MFGWGMVSIVVCLAVYFGVTQSDRLIPRQAPMNNFHLTFGANPHSGWQQRAGEGIYQPKVKQTPASSRKEPMADAPDPWTETQMKGPPSSTAEPHEPAPTYYPRSRRDVYQVAFLLRQKLVADLVAPILEEAEYWPVEWQTTAWRPAQVSPISDAPRGRVILKSLPLAKCQAGRVRKVVFTVWSHDQGWSSGGGGGGRGSKDGSWTWFEAHVAKAGAPEFRDPDHPSRISKAEKAGWTCCPPRKEGAPPWEGKRLITNPKAIPQPTKATAEWRWQPDEDGGSEQKKLLRSLGTGDSIALTAHAMFPGWTNFVKYAEIDVYYAYIR